MEGCFMKKILALIALTNIATGAYGACEQCETKNVNKNWVVRNTRAAKCWIARKVFRMKKHAIVTAAIQNNCTRCGKTFR